LEYNGHNGCIGYNGYNPGTSATWLYVPQSKHGILAMIIKICSAMGMTIPFYDQRFDHGTPRYETNGPFTV